MPDRKPADAGLTAEAARAAARSEGLAAGRAAGEAQVRAEAARLAEIAAGMRGAVDALQDQIAEAVLDLALEVARQVLRADPRVRREGLLAVVREGLAALPQEVTGTRLLLNPGDAEFVRAQIGDELAAGTVRIVDDFRIEPGGCRLVAANCDVDGTLATRWRRVLATIGRDNAWVE
jgi:flagellar assembly protein FliH